MKYLFDTDVVSALLRGKPSQQLLQHIQNTPWADMAISSITLADLLYGAKRNESVTSHYVPRIDTFATTVTVFSFDEQAARIYSMIRVSMEKSGRIIGYADMQIGSIALAQQLVMVTRNVRHFAQIPQIAVENWIDD